jgi:hypothetical protein
MCLRTLHDRVRNLGLGAMYERHARSEFRDLFDNASPDWDSSALAEKVIDLKAFASAGVSAGEIIGHYRETMNLDGKPEVLASLPATMGAYREAGYWPPLPEEIESAMDGRRGR